jgi:signal transduction histidine kinase
MKYIVYLLLFTSFVFGIELTVKEKSFLEKNGPITMCVDPDWEPFEIIEDGIHKGLAADLINLVSQRLEVEIKLIQTKTWQESLEYSQAGTCDILSFLNKTPQREKWLTFTEPIFSDPNVLVGRAEMSYIEDISKENLSIALPRGTAMAEFFIRDFPNLTIIPTTSEAEAFKLVEEKKADLTLRSLIVAAYTIKKQGLFNLKIVGEPKGYENHLRIGIVKNKPIIKEILNKGIATLTAQDVDRIVNNHVSVTIEKVTSLGIAVWVFVVLVLVVILVLLWNYLLNKRVQNEVVKNLEQQKLLIEQKRKAEIGELIANISHQWKNGLTQISSLNLELLLMYEFDQEFEKQTVIKRLQETESSIEFMKKTMNTFLSYYKGEVQTTEFFVKKNIEEVLQLVGIQIKQVNLNIHIDEIYPLQVKGDENEWYHIWLNLISNTIKIVQQREKNDPKVTITIEKQSIVYEDNCGGIEKENLKEMDSNKQKGLGLKMCRGILEKHGWVFKIQNQSNGVKFQLFLKS